MPTGRGFTGFWFPVVSIQPRLTQAFVVELRPSVARWPYNTLFPNCKDLCHQVRSGLLFNFSSGSDAHSGAVRMVA